MKLIFSVLLLLHVNGYYHPRETNLLHHSTWALQYGQTPNFFSHGMVHSHLWKTCVHFKVMIGWQMPQHNSSSYGYSSHEFSRAWIVSLDTGGTFSNDGSSFLLLTDPSVKSIISGGGEISVGGGGYGPGEYVRSSLRSLAILSASSSSADSCCLGVLVGSCVLPNVLLKRKPSLGW